MATSSGCSHRVKMAENDFTDWDTQDPEKAKWDYYLKDLDRCEFEQHDEDDDGNTMAVAATTIASPGASKNAKLKTVTDVDIDKSGKFKYILIKVHDPDVTGREFKHIVRGYNRASLHAEIIDEIRADLEDKGLDCEVVGGGRIKRDKKGIVVHGYSKEMIRILKNKGSPHILVFMQFGRADHKLTARLLELKLGSESISWSNDGY